MAERQSPATITDAARRGFDIGGRGTFTSWR
jgi:hypothetical protein